MNLTLDPAIQRQPVSYVVAHDAQSVHCIHCFKTVGKETPKTSRKKLLARHRCPERELAKQPAAPPPYN